MLKHSDDLTKEEKKLIDSLIEDVEDGDNEQLPDEFDEEEGCTPPKES